MTSDGDVTVRNEALLRWYGTARRELPWRADPGPYATLVSEAMLQQTQVDRVVPKFEEFMARWPTVDALATSDPTEVLAVWSGLGYNARALRLREAAAMVADSGWPTSVSDLQHLPGVGPYTASAIAAMAFGDRVAAVDTNLRRVISRWQGIPLTGRDLAHTADTLVVDPAGDWNQALMDLGATVCRPRHPKCGECPVSDWCTDPDVYEPPRRQSAFEGSGRQLRGALVRANLAGDDLLEAGTSMGRSHEEVETAISTLTSEGLLPASSARSSTSNEVRSRRPKLQGVEPYAPALLREDPAT